MSDLVPAQTTEAELAILQELGGVGLEDVDQSDLVMPRLQVKHQKQLFVNPQTNEEFEELEVVLLGMLKQRSLFPAVYDGENNPPLCRSLDFETGFPRADVFPWEESGFDLDSYDDETGLPCEDCLLKDWGSHPTKPKAPWCEAQHTYPLLILGEGGSMTPMIYTVSKTGLTPSKNYVSYFVTNKKPMFTVVTRLTLDAARKGGNDYSVPRFERLGATDSSKWRYWAEQFTSIKDMLHTRIQRDDTPAQPVAAPARKAAARPAASRPAPPKDEDLWADAGDTPEG
jgi:hypothetical protein